MILAALRAAKRKHKAISLAFCDIAKAYDTVCRELLYTKLRKIGFGGKVVALIRSMNYIDCVRVNFAQRLSDPIYFTQGVKQGSSLSPMLFALYIASLGASLQETNLGIEFGYTTLTALFFADDLLLLSSTPKGGMNKLLNIVTEFCILNVLCLLNMEGGGGCPFHSSVRTIIIIIKKNPHPRVFPLTIRELSSLGSSV